MIAVNGWCAGGMEEVGKWGDECSATVGGGKDFCPHFLQPFLENIHRSCNDGSRELIPVFHNPHQK